MEYYSRSVKFENREVLSHDFFLFPIQFRLQTKTQGAVVRRPQCIHPEMQESRHPNLPLQDQMQNHKSAEG